MKARTVASASQLILAPILPFFLTALGLRRLLLPLSLGFVCVAFCIPFISGYENLLVAHALMGLLIGSFVTATIQIMLKHLPPPWWVVVLAFFTFRVSLGINSGVYFYRIEHSTTMTDVSGGFAKSVAFAILVTLACGYKG